MSSKKKIVSFLTSSKTIVAAQRKRGRPKKNVDNSNVKQQTRKRARKNKKLNSLVESNNATSHVDANVIIHNPSNLNETLNQSRSTNINPRLGSNEASIQFRENNANYNKNSEVNRSHSTPQKMNIPTNIRNIVTDNDRIDVCDENGHVIVPNKISPIRPVISNKDFEPLLTANSVPVFVKEVKSIFLKIQNKINAEESLINTQHKDIDNVRNTCDYLNERFENMKFCNNERDKIIRQNETDIIHLSASGAKFEDKMIRTNELKHLYHPNEEYIALKVPKDFPIKILTVPDRTNEKLIEQKKKEEEERETKRNEFIAKYKLRRKKIIQNKASVEDSITIETDITFD